MTWSPERKAAWLSRVSQSNYKPANGPGHGGPAKGAGRPVDPSSDAQRAVRAQATPERVADRKAAVEEALATQVHIMRYGQTDMVRLQAATAVQDRIEGKAVQRTIETPHGETVEELRVIDASRLTPEQRDTLRGVLTALPRPAGERT